VQVAYESGVRVFLELEPGTALARLARDIIPDVAARSVEEFKTLSGVSDWVSRRLER
jgi:[acyl-carrier-protein] S-malonyltransferase